MKKLLSLLLALVMIFSLCACTDSGDSGKDSDDEEKEEKEEIEYPITAEFELTNMPYTLTIEDKKNIRVSTEQYSLTQDDLDLEEDANVTLIMHLVGTYKERKGVYTATLDTCKYSLEIKGKDKAAIKEALLDYFDDEDYLDEYEDLVNGKEVDMTEEMDYPGGVVAFELDGDEIERFVIYEEDGETISTEYTFHSNGNVKKEIQYWDGEPYYYYEYDKKGNLTDEGSMESGGNEPTVAPPNTTPPTTAPTYPTETAPMPTEPVEQQYYSITVWVSDAIVDLTYEQIQVFNSTNEYGIFVDAYVVGVSESDAANQVLADMNAAPDLYCFAQDQTSRLVSAGALSVLDGDATDFVWLENDYASAEAAYVGGNYWAYPMTSDNGYFMYYDKSIISDPDNLEAIIADCEASGQYFSFELENAWYTASFFFATGCESQWEVDDNGQFVGVYDTFNSDNGLIAVRGMQKLLQSSCYNNSSTFYGSAAVVSGIWNYEAAKAEYGDNLGIADLPSFTVDGWAYHLSSFHGSKLLGVKPQSDYGKEYALHLLAQYLTGEECQLERYEYVGWGPSNTFAQMDEAVQSNAALAALQEQAYFAVPQGQIHGSWWDIAKLIATEVKYGTDPQIALDNYQYAIDNLFGMSDEELYAWTVIGNVSGTSWDTDFKMEEQYDGTWRTVDMLYFDVYSEFKIRQGLSWDVNYGADGFNGANVAMYVEGWYYVVFDPWSGSIWLEQ